MGIISRGTDRISFMVGSPWILINYRERRPITPVSEDNGRLMFPDDAVTAIKSLLVMEPADPDRLRVAAILIDPGHGGKDPGTIGGYRTDGNAAAGKTVKITEKDVNLAVSIDLFAALTAAYPDKKILLTRNSDTYPTLEERVEMANSIHLGRNEAIIFISIHTNASLNSKAKGIEVWYLPPEYRRTVVSTETHPDEPEEVLPILNSMLEEEFTVESIILAKKILDSVIKEAGQKTENRGLKEESWFVVRNARMPSVLIELGFVTNNDEAALLGSADYLIQLSRGIYNGIKEFINYFETTVGFTQ
ncbi:MAG: N-acetylmuramoyl-L-alanine amidase [Spirochaetales bacterium]|nr:MAG: N-acetylmuramoyl-L-alanine amidase [Spirochaetales bacterium]